MSFTVGTPGADAPGSPSQFRNPQSNFRSPLKPDDELCLCFHVTRRKVENYLRLERLTAPSQLAECYGAGTGCGWCRQLLVKLFEAHKAKTEVELPDAAEHASGRGEYVRAGKGTPPAGATPIEGGRGKAEGGAC